jgi:uncharacterized protein
MTSHFILYVAEQDTAREFYQRTLDVEPRLHVVGMTEFVLPGGAVLGLMPEAGIRRLLGESLPEADSTLDLITTASRADANLRAELYLLVEDPEVYLQRAIEAGAELLQPMQPRDWGHEVAYCRELDGYILAFARAEAGKIHWFRRLHNAIGPVAAGLVLDFCDLVTFGPLGWTIGPVIGLVVGWYLGAFYKLKWWSRLGLSLLSAAYLAVPMTAFLPLGTLISALARLFSGSKSDSAE